MAGTKGKSGTSQNSKKNLTNIKDMVTTEERIENGKKGGVASGKARREKRDMQKRINDIFEMTLRKGKEEDFKNVEDSDGKNLSVMDALILKQVEKALDGDTKALEFLRDSAGLKPIEKQEVKTEIKGAGKLSEILSALEDDEDDE